MSVLCQAHLSLMNAALWRGSASSHFCRSSHSSAEVDASTRKSQLAAVSLIAAAIAMLFRLATDESLPVVRELQQPFRVSLEPDPDYPSPRAPGSSPGLVLRRLRIGSVCMRNNAAYRDENSLNFIPRARA